MSTPLRFVALFALLLGAYYALALVPAFDRALYWYLAGNAWASNALLRLAGQATRLSGVTIRSDHFAISVRRGCDAIEPAWFFCAAVLAFPGPRKRGRIMLVGVAVILTLNLARIVSLFLIGVSCPGLFPAAHLEIWPAVFILTVVALWLYWIVLPVPPARTP
jgi:exosortase/archaeosortase family protein